MKRNKLFRKLAILGCIATVLVPIIIYLYGFYSSQTDNIPLNNSEFLIEGVLSSAILAFFNALLTAIIVGLIASYSKKLWGWIKLIFYFCIIFLFSSLIFYLIIRLLIYLQ